MEQPNILLLFTDQHKLSAVGCYAVPSTPGVHCIAGETPCQTPNVDRLAQDGIRFETAYTVCPVCSPARATIMTGLYPHAHGVCSNVHDLGSSVHELTDRPGLLSRRLERAGYVCGYSGKWHLGTDQGTAFGGHNTPTLPRDVGFQGQNFPGHGGGGFDYPEYKAYLAEHGFKHEVTRIDDRPIPVKPYGILKGPVESTVPYFLAEHTIGLIDAFAAAGASKASDRPFFIWHNFWGPHIPYFSTIEFYDLYRGVDMPEWPNFRWPAQEINGPHQVKIHPQVDQLTWEDWAEGIRHYYAFTTLIDQQIGRIVDHLDETGLRENTIILFTADHGETLGTHGGLYDKGWHHFEEIQRIPFIVWMPRRFYQDGIDPGAVLQEWVSLADVYPTILDLAGAGSSPDSTHGRSLLPLLMHREHGRGSDCPQSAASGWRDKAFVEFYGVNSLATSMVSVRAGEFKYGWNCSNRDELYDLGQDPFEMHNLIDKPLHRDTVSEMRAMVETWMEETDHPGLRLYRQSRLGKVMWSLPPRGSPGS